MNSRGFSLVELVLVILLTGILAAVSLPMLMGGFNAYTQQVETSKIEREAMLGLERISRELRMSPNVVVTTDDEIMAEQLGAGGTTTISHDSDTDILSLNGSVLANDVTSFVPEGPIEHSDSGACYLRVVFTTLPSLEWQQVVFLRNISECSS